MSPNIRDLKKKPRRPRAIEEAKNASRTSRAQPEAVPDLSNEQMALAVEIISTPIQSLAKKSRALLTKLNATTDEILNLAGSKLTIAGTQEEIRIAVDDEAADATAFSALAFVHAENTIQGATKRVGGDPRRPLTRLSLMEDFGRLSGEGKPLVGSLDGNLAGADLMRRLDATFHGLRDMLNTIELGEIIKTGMASGDSLIGYALETAPLRQRDEILFRAKPNLKTPWPEMREQFRRARNPEGFAALDSRRDLGRAVLEIADATFTQLANVVGMSAPYLIEQVLDPRAQKLRSLVK